jgi:hypothetical protein
MFVLHTSGGGKTSQENWKDQESLWAMHHFMPDMGPCFLSLKSGCMLLGGHCCCTTFGCTVVCGELVLNGTRDSPGVLGARQHCQSSEIPDVT